MTVKEETKVLLDKLPDNCTYDDVMYEIYVKQKIQKGLDDVASGKTYSHEDAKKRLSAN